MSIRTHLTTPHVATKSVGFLAIVMFIAILGLRGDGVSVLSAVEISDSVAAIVVDDVTVHPQAGWVDDDGALRSRKDRTTVITFTQHEPHTPGTEFFLRMRARHRNGPSALYQVGPEWSPDTLTLAGLDFYEVTPIGIPGERKDVWLEIDVTDWMRDTEPLSVLIGSAANVWFYSTETIGSEPVIIARNGTPLEQSSLAAETDSGETPLPTRQTNNDDDDDDDDDDDEEAQDRRSGTPVTIVRPPTTLAASPDRLRIVSPAEGATFTETGTISIEAELADPDQVQVDFYVDGNFVGAEESAPYVFNWTIDAASNGEHIIRAEFEDGPERVVSTTRTIMVDIPTDGATTTTVNSTPSDSTSTPPDSTSTPPDTSTPSGPVPSAGTPIVANAETAPVKHGGDAADDPAIWVDRANPERSTIIGTDKLGGIGVYDLAGRELHFYAVGRVNNIDLRDDFPLGGKNVSLVAGSERDSDDILFFSVDPATRGLTEVGSVQSGLGVAGLCMYRNNAGEYSVFVSDSSGSVEHWAIDSSGSTISGRKVRTIRLGSTTEGCVADDENGWLYISEEDRGIWRYPAEVGTGTDPVMIAATTSNGGSHLRADIEGLAIWKGGSGGYLVASSQANNTFVVYSRDVPNKYVATFEVQAGTIDGVDYTDGIEITSANLGSAYPNGIFVAQDNTNGSANQNFKIVDWNRIAGSALGFKPTSSPAPTTPTTPPTTVNTTVATTAPTTTAPTSTTASTSAPTSTPPTSQSQTRTDAFYVDSETGSDSNTGTSEGTAWKTLTHAANQLGAGDTLLLKGSWREPLDISASGTSAAPIVIDAVSPGSATLRGTSTCIRLRGDYIIVQGLTVRDCTWSGFTVEGDNNLIDSNLITANVTGIYVKSAGTNTRILNNEIVDNNVMSVNDPGGRGDSGAFGVLLHGSNTEVAYNIISGSDAFSFDYGRDGAAVEIFGAVNSHIHHNRAHNNDTFAELGEPGTSGNRFDHNVVTSTLETSVFLVTRGADTNRGPVTGTIVEHNSVLLTGSKSQGFVCHAGCSKSILTLRNNIIEAQFKAGYADGPFITGGNVFHGGQNQFPASDSDRTGAPLWLNADLEIEANSPATGFGLPLGYEADYNGSPIPAQHPNSGALQN
ncbi:MAG: phytase [Acidimicrobiales bacterium]|nr:phytase [Acidimicrobiales bacterium]